MGLTKEDIGILLKSKNVLEIGRLEYVPVPKHIYDAIIKECRK